MKKRGEKLDLHFRQAFKLLDQPRSELENSLRHRGGQAGYEDGFIDNYIMPVLYPIGLTRNVQYALGIFALLINVVAYTMYFRRRRRSGL